MSQPRWDFFIAHGETTREEARALYEALARDARVFSRGVSVAAGDDLGAVGRALGDAGVVVVLLDRSGDVDPGLADDLAAAIERARGDAARCFVPVYLDAEAEQRKRYGTATVQGIARHREGREATVARLRALVAGLRKRWNARPRVALVGVAAELGGYLEAAAKRLPSRAEVSVIDAAAVDAVERARRCDLRVVLVGGRTGGRDALRALCDEGARALKLAKVDPDEIPEEEFAALKPLRRSIEARDGFASEDEAAARVQVLFAEWEKEWVTVATGAGASLEAWERAWLLARHTKWKTGAHEGLREASRGRTIERARLYVPLRAVATETEFVDATGELVVRDRTVLSEDAPVARELRLEKEAQRGPWLEALVTHPALPSVVVEAPAGAGKTVLLQHIACALTTMHFGEPAEAGEVDVEALAAGAPLLRVPLLVEARRLAEGVAHGTLGELLNALARELSEHGGHTVDAAAVRDGLAAGRYLLLVDSLDEVPGVAGRAAVLHALDALLAQGWKSRVVLTTRPTAHTGLNVGPRFRLVRIVPLDDDRAAALIGRWADAMGEDTAYRRDAEAAVRELRARQGGDAEGGIVANPLLLTCTLLVYDQERLLPDSLADLYERLVEILCRAKATPGYTYDAKRELLERVCEATQRAGGTALEVREAAEVLLGARPELGTVDRATDLLDTLAADTGLLRFETVRAPNDRRDRRVVRPWHRSFQEFLVARRLGAGRGAVAEETDRLLEGADPVAFDPAWENALAFLAGVYGNQGTERARAYAERLTERGMREGAVRPGRLLGLAARVVAEYSDLFRDGALRERLRHAVADAFARDGVSWPLHDRLLALEALGRIGDPRLEGDWWVEVPGGTFTFRPDESQWSDGTQQWVVSPGERVTLRGGDSYQRWAPPRVTVASFRIAWRPVTVWDYAPFVEAGAYRDDTYWEGVPDGARFEEPEDWAAQRFHPNRPVVGVSWHEAVAWCRWASRARGEVITLPTQEEWEFAARGEAGDVYPWGEVEPGEGDGSRANHQMQVGHATPVGAFSRGDRGRLVDLAGNVWEWTTSAWQTVDMPVDRMTSGAPRVVRGDSWSDRRLSLRRARRGRDFPGHRYQDMGFRVVVRGSRQLR